MTTQITAVRIPAGRVTLQPLSPAQAQDTLGGDLTWLAGADPAGGWTAGVGWPHDDTLDGLRGVTQDALGWLVVLDSTVIGDCGTLGGLRPSGDIEIGYGLAEPYRGQGYGTELVQGLAGWLATQPGVRRVVAGTLPDNVPSRKVLERAGFVFEGIEQGDDGDGEGEVRYALDVRSVNG
jgi:RimJ/RimL family protein N-acetyltransferase